VTDARAYWPSAVVGFALGAGALALIQAPAPVRPVVVVAFALFCPGLALVRLIDLEDHLAELMLGIMLSLALDTIVSIISLYTRAWTPDGVLATLIAISVAGSAWELGRVARRGPAGRRRAIRVAALAAACAAALLGLGIAGNAL
jgi:hypothetical protein